MVRISWLLVGIRQLLVTIFERIQAVSMYLVVIWAVRAALVAARCAIIFRSEAVAVSRFSKSSAVLVTK